jgi:hypothetical protein
MQAEIRGNSTIRSLGWSSIPSGFALAIGFNRTKGLSVEVVAPGASFQSRCWTA